MGNKVDFWERTKNPRRVCRSRYIPDRRKPLALSKNNIYEGRHTNRECSELILHGVLVVRTFATEGLGETSGSYSCSRQPNHQAMGCFTHS